jgi:hypothetical protein
MEMILEQSAYPLVKPGSYRVMLDSFRTVRMFKCPKLELTFTIVSFGDAHGVRLPRFFNVDRFTSKAGKNGGFSVSPNRDFPRELLTLFNYECKRKDRYPMSLFNGVTIEADVITVKEARGRVIPAPLRYSKINKLVRVIEGA